MLYIYCKYFKIILIVDIDTVKRILNVVLKIRYDLETLSQKQHHMDQTISEMILKVQDNETRNEASVMFHNQMEDCDSLLPISNEEQLNEFETKLLEKIFKTNVVCYLNIKYFFQYIFLITMYVLNLG